MGGVEDTVQGVGPIGLPHVRQDQRPQLDGFAVGPAGLSGGDLIGWYVEGLARRVGLPSQEEVENLAPPTEDLAVCLELGTVCEHVDPGSVPASVDVLMASANQSQAVAPGIFLISRSHHDIPCLLNPGRA